ncbi:MULTISPECIES: YdhR family protein [Nostoc]|uniref:YdhR family protein n=2 Tax=Nostoc TaxID=1177 RepID=A0ABR8IBI7_9NOSO|nr:MULTISPECIES: YdhR family protein [Nostoc]MBD2560275.1 YdhR family protein [Nostoc linckia FACHB-391]MBD2648743.1 YdhR family protein [Nostoc foliaceum FACHB-393]
MSKVFVYAEYQVSIPFSQIDWVPINIEMKKFPGLRSKTWLNGVNNNTIGGFYEFDSVENAQNYIDGLLIPFTKQVNGNLTVKLFDGHATKEASIGMSSPFYAADSQ